MKKILILTNHLQNSDGVCRSAINLANYLSNLPDIEVTLRPLFKYDDKMLKSLDSKVIVKPKYKFYIRGSKRIFKLLPKSFLYKIFVKGNYDIEIGFCLILPQLAILGSKNKNAKHVIWTHGYEWHDIYNNAEEIVCCSVENKHRTEEDLTNKVPVFAVHNLLPTETIEEKAKDECDLKESDLLTFITVARMDTNKGFARILDAAKTLKEEGYKFRCVFVGTGSEYEPLRKKCTSLGLDDYIVFTGEQRNPYNYMAHSDIYLCSSFSEGYSTTVTEAYLVGIPAISTLIGGAKEMIEESECGEVVENTTKGIYKGMKNVLDHPELVKEWKEKISNTKYKFGHKNREQEILIALGIK